MATPGIPVELKAKLWPHQVEACDFALARMRGPTHSRSTLVRMPTGTGKTGIVATLAMSVPPPGWTLVLTPWKNLCRQMTDDLRERFWITIDWKPENKVPVTRLFPKNIGTLLEHQGAQLVVIASFATLVRIFKEKRKQYRNLANRLAQIVVDEGHYEPAVEWGQAVKQLKKPTLLLTATPYRNDLKLFRVEKGDTRHYTHEEAERDRVIRRVEFAELPIDEPTDAALADWCKYFVEAWKKARSSLPVKNPRAIVCCAKAATVQRVTTLLRNRHHLKAIGIHERFAKATEPWLVQSTPDPKDPVEGKYDVWVHQNKLTEGLDDNRFCVVAFLNRVGNDRKLVQQIGRVLRTQNRAAKEQALVLFSRDLSVRRSWRYYREFEIGTDIVDPARYERILKTLLDAQPEMEYFGGRFRTRFKPRSRQLPEQVLLNAGAVVRRIRHRFDLEEFSEFTSDFLLLEDRVLLGADEYFRGKDGARLWVYAVIGNSRLLISESQYEIKLGALAAVQHSDLLFLVDTEGIYPFQYLNEHTQKIGQNALARVLGSRIIPKEVSLSNPWPAGPVIRRATIFADNLAATPAQFTDAALVCAGARANLPPAHKEGLTRRQYVGFLRSRVTEQLRSAARSEFNLKEFVAWTKTLAHSIEDNRRKSSAFFRRYLAPVEPPDQFVPHYLVLNLFSDEIELQDGEDNRLELAESIVQFQEHETDDEDNPDPKSDYRCTLRFLNDKNEEDGTTSYEVKLDYDPQIAKFSIHGEELNTEVKVVDNSRDSREGICSFLNNNDEVFTIVLDTGDLFYTGHAFYQIDYSYAETLLGKMITPITALETIESEKGEPGARSSRWSSNSVFGLIDGNRNPEFVTEEFGDIEWLFCDDLGTEVADFVCANFSEHKIAFIHAKSSEGRTVAASALHDVVAQAQKNLGIFARSGEKPAHLNRWDRSSLWKKTRIHRWRHGSNSLPQREALWHKIREEILDHPDASKEIWLVVGQTLNKDQLLAELTDPEQRDAVTGQVVHLLSSLSAAAIQLNVRLRVFSH